MRSPFQLRSSIDEDLCPCLVIWLPAATSSVHNSETVYLEVGNVLRDLFSKAMVCSSSSELILLQLVSFSAFFRDYQIDWFRWWCRRITLHCAIVCIAASPSVRVFKVAKTRSYVHALGIAFSNQNILTVHPFQCWWCINYAGGELMFQLLVFGAGSLYK